VRDVPLPSEAAVVAAVFGRPRGVVERIIVAAVVPPPHETPDDPRILSPSSPGAAAEAVASPGGGARASPARRRRRRRRRRAPRRPRSRVPRRLLRARSRPAAARREVVPEKHVLVRALFAPQHPEGRSVRANVGVELKGVRSGVERRRGVSGIETVVWAERNAGKVLKKRRAPRERGRMGTSVRYRTRLSSSARSFPRIASNSAACAAAASSSSRSIFSSSLSKYVKFLCRSMYAACSSSISGSRRSYSSMYAGRTEGHSIQK